MDVQTDTYRSTRHLGMAEALEENSGFATTMARTLEAAGRHEEAASYREEAMWDLVEAAEHRQAIEDLRAGEEFEDDLAALEDFDPLAIGRRSRDRVPGAPGPRSRL